MNINNKVVSIITPVYNCEKYLEETIKSVINQTYEEWEWIFIDDKTPDNSVGIIEKYMNLDKRIKLVRMNENVGAAVARNRGIEKAKGRFIAFLDSDDLWNNNKLEKQVSFMINNNYGFTFTSYEVIDENSNSLNKIVKAKNIWTYKDALKNTLIQTVTVIIDRNIIGDFRMPNVRKGQDYATWLMILRQKNNAYGLDINLAKYRRTPGSLSSNKIQAVKRTWRVYRECEKLSVVKTIYCFIGYAYNACMKRFYFEKIFKF